MPLPELITNSPTLGSSVPLGTLEKAFNLGELTLETAEALPQKYWPTSTEEANWVQFHAFIGTELVVVAATRDETGKVTGAGKTFSCTAAGTFTAKVTEGSAVLTEAPGVLAVVGQPVTGPHIPAGAYVTNVGSETVTISAAGTATESPITVTYYNRCAEGSAGATHAVGVSVWNELTAGALLGMLAYQRAVTEVGRSKATGESFPNESPNLITTNNLICYGALYTGLSGQANTERFVIEDGRIGSSGAGAFEIISAKEFAGFNRLIGNSAARAQYAVQEYVPQRLTIGAPTPKRLTLNASGGSIIFLTAEIEVTITSMKSAVVEGEQRDGTCVTLINVASQKINLESESAEGTASQRFKLIGVAAKGVRTLSEDDSIMLVYDATRKRWVQRAAMA